MLVVVCGLPGTGKSTVSRRVADRIDGRLVRTDVVRKELFPDPEYTSAESSAVYAEVLERARETLSEGGRVVLDGTFRRRELRERVAGVAVDCGRPYRFVRVECDEAVVRERIAVREDDESDADFEVYKLLKAEFEPLDGEHIVVDNSGSLAATTARVDQLFPAATPE